MFTLSKTGNNELDEQHVVMQGCLSDLASLLKSTSEPATLLGSLEALCDYVEWHFIFEERLLKQIECPDVDAHIAEHRAIVDQLNSLRRKLGAGNSEVASLISIVSHWIVDHLNHAGSELAKYLTCSQVSPLQPAESHQR